MKARWKSAKVHTELQELTRQYLASGKTIRRYDKRRRPVDNSTANKPQSAIGDIRALTRRED
jgi:hypothetical protein